MTEIIGHRGVPGLYSDNSLTGINAAKQYCSAVEIDLRLTKDSEIFLFHDPDINGVKIHCKDKDDLISEFSHLNIQDYHLTSRNQLGLLPVFFEMKVDGVNDEQREILKEKTIALVTEEDTIICFDWNLIFEIRNRTISRYGIHIENEEQLYEAKSISLLDQNMLFMVKAELIEVRAFDLPVNRVVAWTVNSIDLAKRLIQMEINGIITDIPEDLSKLTK
jgi:glycerophosphoryl diester phosphodiesterase